MSKVSAFVKKRKVLIIILSVVLVLAIIAAVVINSVMGMLSGLGAMLSTPSVTSLSKQNIENVIVATGQTSSTQSRIVVSNAAAGTEILSLNIEVGDAVTQNDVLAQLDDEAVLDKIDDAQDSYSDKQTDISYSDALSSHDLALAQDKVNDAAQAYNDAKNQYAADLQAITDQKNQLNASLATNVANLEAQISKQIEDLLEDWANAQVVPPATTNPLFPQLDINIPSTYQPALNDHYSSLLVSEQQDMTNLTSSTYSKISDLNSSVTALQQNTAAEIAKLDEQASALTSTYSSQESANLSSLETAQNSLTQQQIQADSTNSTNSRTLADLGESISDAQAELDDTFIRSPISGVVTELSYEAGDILGTSALCTIQDLTNLQIVTTVPSYDVVKLSEGMQAVFTTDSTGDTEISGTISEISPIAIDESGNFSVTITASETNKDLRVGVPAQVTFLLQSATDIYAVPIDAVVEQDGKQYIYVYDTMPTAEEAALGEEDGRRMVEITTGLESDYLIEIISDELHDGLLILDDPMGLNISSAFDMSAMGSPGGEVVVTTETGGGPGGGGPPAGGR